MAVKVLIFSLLLSLALAQDPLKDALNGVQVFMNPAHPEFDPEFYNELITCLDYLDPRLVTSVGAQWDGMLQYAESQGTPNDPWQPCNLRGKWFELNCTTQEYGNMPIYEPCNYASNLAYYHTATEICAKERWSLPTDQVKAMGMAFAILAHGSAFFHGSETDTGGSADVRLNDLFAYVAYQAAMENVEPSDNSIIHELSLTPRNKSALETTSDFLDMYIEVPVEEWRQLLEDAEIPNLRLTMCGYFSTVLTLLYPPDVVDGVVDFLLGQFTEITEDIEVFCLQQFLPEVREVVTKNRTLPQDEFLKFEGNTFSTLIKLLYAFLWQEEALTTDDIFLQPIANEIGMFVLPLINGIGNRFNNFTYSDNLMQSGINMYPGEEWCNLVIPHAKWHLQTSIALTDFTFLSDELARLLDTYFS